MSRWLLTASLGLLVASPAMAQSRDDVAWQDISVRVSVAAPFSPFAWVQYEWKTRGTSPMVTWSRVHVADFGRDNELALVPTETYAAWVEDLAPCRRAVTESGVELDAAFVTIRLAVGDEAQEVSWPIDALSLDASACLDVVRGRALEVIDVPPYRNPYWREGESGLLRIDADAAAHVYVDGVDTRETTPVMDYPVAPGQHEIRWVNTATGLERLETVTVGVGQTTSIRVELR